MSPATHPAAPLSLVRPRTIPVPTHDTLYQRSPRKAAMKTARRKRSGQSAKVAETSPDDVFVRPADARRRTRTADQLLGLQERAGPGPAPPFPANCGPTGRRSNPGRWPSSSATTAPTTPATSSPSAASTTATSTASTGWPRANIRLAAHVAKRFRHHALGYADLLQEAVCGLMQAIDRFDVSHGTRLATYATWWIRQTLQIAVARQSHLVSLSPHHLQELGLLQQESEALAHGGKHLPSPQELASPHRQQPRTPDPPPDRHPHPGLPQRRPRRRQRLQADRGDAGQRAR